MGSKFSTSSRSTKTPSWCRPGLFPVPPVYAAGIPLTIVCFSYWLDLTAIPPIDSSESFTVEYRVATNDWYGQSGTAGVSLSIRITRPGPPNVFDFFLEVSRDGSVLDDDSWHNVLLPPSPPFDSGLLEHIWIPQVGADGLHAVS